MGEGDFKLTPKVAKAKRCIQMRCVISLLKGSVAMAYKLESRKRRYCIYWPISEDCSVNEAVPPFLVVAAEIMLFIRLVPQSAMYHKSQAGCSICPSFPQGKQPSRVGPAIKQSKAVSSGDRL